MWFTKIGYIDRKGFLNRIKKLWVEFKICDCCDTIVEEDVYVCMVCRCYRFNKDKKEIINRSMELYDKYTKAFNDRDPV